ncbi:hypothetical protein HYALB_00004598 [Hymenoscyphus albidus]|uniref:Uncharacterized protein n=1 Tax=Hymenoscyphus albidus TaxID=595503 RepID=A0A9N9QCX0_9HELO|nr:hypothetical protein HYALB_00004598 [Hymenoscyphus albidus]
MSVEKYTENLPAEAAFAVRALLTVPKEAQDKWAEDVRTRFTQYCNAVKGEGSNEMNWTKEQWMTPLPEMLHFFQQIFVLSAKADLGIWTNDEVRAWKQFSERVPMPPFTEEDEVAAREERERNYRGAFNGRDTSFGYIGRSS